MDNKLIFQNAALLNQLRYNQTLDKTSLAKVMGVSWPTISKSIKELENAGLVIFKENTDSYIHINPDFGIFAGVSIGSAQSKIVFSKFDLKIFSAAEFAQIKTLFIEELTPALGSDRFFEECKTDKEKNYVYFSTPKEKYQIKTVLNIILECIKKIAEDSRYAYKIMGIGLACTGTVDSKEQMIIEAHNLKCLNNTALKELIYQDKKKFLDEYNIPVYIVQNRTAAVIAEKYALYFNGSEYRESKNILAIYLGAGIGAGMIFNGELYTGDGYAGEAGHMPVQYYGKEEHFPGEKPEEIIGLCSCGNKNCYENKIRSNVFDKDIEDFSLEESLSIRKYLEMNEDKCYLFGRYIGSLVNSLTSLLNVNLIIFTGKFSKSMDLLWEPISCERDKSPFNYSRICDLISSDLGALSPAVGAAIASYHYKYGIPFKW